MIMWLLVMEEGRVELEDQGMEKVEGKVPPGVVQEHRSHHIGKVYIRALYCKISEL
jgi:hypothetical protein